MFQLFKRIDGPWEQARGYIKDDLETIETVLNQRWGATFGESNVLPPSSGGTGIISITDGSIVFGSGGTFAEDNANLFYDEANVRIGLGTNSPNGVGFHLLKTQNGSTGILAQNFSATGGGAALFRAQADTGTLSLFMFSSAFSSGGIINANWGLLTVDSASSGLMVGTLGSDPLAFGTNNLERMRILSDGKVGIGTSAPEDLLEVQGAEGLDAVLVLDADDGDDNADTWFIKSVASSNALTFTNHTSVRVTFTSGGDVGINRTSPQSFGANYQTLEIGGNTTSTGGVFQSSSSDSSVKARLFVDSSQGFTGTSTAHDFAIQANGSTVATFKNGGNAGVGITNPATKFVVSNGGAEGMEINPTGGNVVFQLFNRNTSAYAASFWDTLSIRFRTGTSPADALMIDSSKNVGIGLTTITAYLHIKAGTSSASTAPIKLTSGTVMTNAEAGAIEFTTDTFFGSITTGPARKGFVMDDGARLTSGKIPVATTNGRLIDLTASSAYTPTNVTTDRAYDANATTLDEIADVLGTVIADLQTKGILG